MTSIVEKTRQFLWMTILGPSPQSPFYGKSYESCVNDSKLLRGEINHDEWCSLEGFNIQSINYPEAVKRLQSAKSVRASDDLNEQRLSRLKKRPSRKVSRGKKVVALDKSKKAIPIKPIETNEEKFLRKWRERVFILQEADFESAKGLTSNKLNLINSKLNPFSIEKIVLSDIGFTQTDVLLMDAIRCADRMSFQYIDPDRELLEGDLKTIVEISARYLQVFPQAQNISRLFKAVWEKRGPK